jgi:hypothetical protein
MQHTILGAIAGDVIGAPFEWNNRKSTDFRLFGPKSRFTDDTVLTVAVAEWLLDGGELTPLLKAYARRYPRAGYGGRFRDWARSENPQPYNSFGNGSAMRVSPVGFAARTLDDALDLAEQSAAVSHDHPEGIRGAQAIAAAIWMARDGASKEDMRGALSERFGYDRLASLGLERLEPGPGASARPSWPSPDGVARPQRAFGPFFGGRATPTGEGQDDGLRRPDLRWGRCAVWRSGGSLLVAGGDVCSLAGGRILSGYLLIRGMLCAAISLRNLGRSRNT